MIRLAALNSTFQTGLRSPMDEAILRHEHPDVVRYHLCDEIPFDFQRRRISVVVEDAGERILITKGAPESVLPVCTTVESAGGPVAFDAAARIESEALFRRLSSDGYRVLAVAYRPVPHEAAYSIADERELRFAGFAAFLDPPCEGVAEMLAALKADGIAVKIITGDNELVTQHICRQVGLDADEIVLGDAVERMSDPALAAVAERTEVFARVSPMQKNRIILALRSRGHVLGYMGDGINDAPALRTADVGISVDTAVDVARDAADIILLEKRLDVLHEGVLEGRRSFGNIMKYVLMGTSSNFGNMLSMAAASMFLPFLPMLPLQILLNNFLYDLAQVPIPSDRVDATYTLKPKRWNVAFIRRFMLLIGPLSSVYDFLTFAVMLKVFHADATLFRTGWFVESLATQTLVIFVIRTAGRPWASRPSAASRLERGRLRPDGRCHSVHAAGAVARLHAAAAAVLRHPGADGRDVPRTRRDRQALVLPPVRDLRAQRQAASCQVAELSASRFRLAGHRRVDLVHLGLESGVLALARVAQAQTGSRSRYGRGPCP